MNIVVTGASSGIGRAIVEQLLTMPSHRVIAIARSEEKMLSLKQAGDQAVGELMCMIGDITNSTFRKQVGEQIENVRGTCDVLINNAGQLVNSSFEKTEMEQVRTLYEVNVFAAMEMVKTTLPYMKSGAHVVSIGSMGGFSGSVKFPGLSWYSSTKAAIANMTECLAEEYKARGISFNCLALGAVQTEMLASAFPDYTAPMSPENMADYIVEFSLKGHKYYNGKVLPLSNSTP
jgi:3-oxoacyl-[acyl-carrier protein] reductase